jgi:hypothetical protein
MSTGEDATATPERQAYNLKTAFRLLHISPSFGHSLIKAGRIRTVRLGPGSPRITAVEISRILEEGLAPVSEKPPDLVADIMTVTPDEDLALLHRVAELSYGPSWQTPLALALGANLRTVQRWAAGSRPISPEAWTRLADLVTTRFGDLSAVLRELSLRVHRAP